MNIRKVIKNTLINTYAILILFISVLFIHIHISIYGANSILSLLYFLLCITIIIQLLLLAKFNNVLLHSKIYKLKYFCFFIISIVFILIVTSLINAHPLNYKDADMLPVIEKMSQRFIAKQQVYKPIPEIWGGMQPVYLPAMWLPYIIPTILHIEIRWMNIMAVVISFLFVFISINNFKQLFIAVLFYIFTCYYFIYVYNNYLLHTEESITLMYVSFLFYGIYKKNWQFIFLAFALLVFSRYWIIVSLPFLLFYYLKQVKITLKHIWPSFFIVMLFVFITPLYQYEVWISLPKLYQSAIRNAANNFRYTPVIDKFGLVKILPNSFRHLITNIGLVVTIISLLFLSIFYKKSSHYLFLIFTITIVFMLSFMIIPYEYLMFTIPFTLFLGVHYKLKN